MNEELVRCPACSSTGLTKIKKTNTLQLTLGPSFQYDEVIYECNNCHEIGDFTAESDKNLELAEKEAQKESVKQLIDAITLQQISLAHFERAFELPARTLTRWKSGDFSASSLALLRTIVTFPWITKVAEERFNPIFAQIVVIKEAANSIGKFVQNVQGSKIDVESDLYTFIIRITNPPQEVGEPQYSVSGQRNDSTLKIGG